MLTMLGLGMVVTFMSLIMTRRLSPMVALIVIPILFALVRAGIPAGHVRHDLPETSPYEVSGQAAVLRRGVPAGQDVPV